MAAVTAHNWREAVAQLLPPWMQGEFGDKLTAYYALLQDGISTTLFEAQRAAWLLETTSPDDVLVHIGNERNMPQYPGETFAQYRARLHGAWEAWTYAGNESSIIGQLEAFGLSDIEIKTPRDWDWDSAAGLTWEEGVGGEDNWSRFWVVIKGHPWVAQNSFTLGTCMGLSATPEEIRTVRSIIQKWKYGAAINPWIIVVLDETTWDAEQPDGTWHDWRNRSQAARYIDGKGQRPVILT